MNSWPENVWQAHIDRAPDWVIPLDKNIFLDFLEVSDLSELQSLTVEGLMALSVWLKYDFDFSCMPTRALGYRYQVILNPRIESRWVHRTDRPTGRSNDLKEAILAALHTFSDLIYLREEQGLEGELSYTVFVAEMFSGIFHEPAH